MPATPTNDATGNAAFHSLAQRISEQEMPAFGPTLHELLHATDADEASGQQVAEVILRDPGLTSRVLRAANAAHLGLTGDSRVVTVSRAVVVLGLNPIRSLCISALAVETLAGASRYAHRVEQALGRALHAAVQVRALALRQQRSRESAERLFVEALLGSIGEIALWCFGESYAERLEQQLLLGRDPEQAEQEVLGASLHKLSRELLHDWRLDALQADSPEVTLGHRLSRAAQQGWDNAPARALTRQVANLLRQDEALTQRQLADNAREAAVLAQALGVAPHAIPGAVQAPLPEPEPSLPEPDLAQQLRALTELASVASSRRELPLLLEACLEGMHRAVGIDRVAFCLLNPARDRLLARIVLGIEADALRGALDLPWDAAREAALRAQPVLRDDAAPTELAAITGRTGAQACLFAAFVLEGNLIGMFYADRAPSARPLDDAVREGFRAFVSQAQLIARGLPRAARAG